MKLSEVLPYFGGNGAALARALGITRGAVHQWQETGQIPELQTLKLKYEILPEIYASKDKESASGKCKSESQPA